MKKLMILAAVAAMATGAWAITYQFHMNIAEIPTDWKALGDRALWGLMYQDGPSEEDRSIVVASGNWADLNNHKNQNEQGFDDTKIGSFVEIAGNEYMVYQFSVAPGASKITDSISGDKKSVDFSFTFEHAEDYDYIFGGDFGTDKGLIAFVFDPDQTGEKQFIEIPGVGYGNIGGARSFIGGTAVPEPTCGLLMLLGLAGLALKRKVA